MTHRGAELQDVANVPLVFLVAAAAACTRCTHCLQSVGHCKTSILPAKTAHADLLRSKSCCGLRRRSAMPRSKNFSAAGRKERPHDSPGSPGSDASPSILAASRGRAMAKKADAFVRRREASGRAAKASHAAVQSAQKRARTAETAQAAQEAEQPQLRRQQPWLRWQQPWLRRWQPLLRGQWLQGSKLADESTQEEESWQRESLSEEDAVLAAADASLTQRTDRLVSAYERAIQDEQEA